MLGTQKSDVLPGLLFSQPMAEICRATLGETAYLLVEQFVVKGARCGLELGWHQDAGYIPFAFSPYTTVWIPLDDVDEANGTLYFLPYSRAGTASGWSIVLCPKGTTWSAISATIPAFP